MTTITPVIMSGGSGTRLWPLSRRARPKQFHALGGDRTLIQETALRFAAPGYAAPIVVCSASHEALVREQLAEIGCTPASVILEPEGRHTAAAAVTSALVAESQGAELVVLLSADARVSDPAALRAAVEAGTPAAQAGSLVIFGIKPTGPETGFGYIRAGAGQGPVRPVAGFVEKPTAADAQRYVADPAYSWNAGIFLFRPDAFLGEARRLAPELTDAAGRALRAADHGDGAIRLGPAFRDVPSVPVDVAIFEKTDKAVVVLADIGWSDVGAYDAIWAEAAKDGDGNALQSAPAKSPVKQGVALAPGSARNLVVSDGPSVVVSGVTDLAVIVHDGVVLVAPRGSAEAVRAAHDAVRKAGREDLL
jgi:mannose-1-phosphate guanylyltransferase/mannose-6-phosphate isomerase